MVLTGLSKGRDAMKSMQEFWFGYSDRIFKDMSVSETQYKETRLAFYAGAWALVNGLVALGDTEDEVAVAELDKVYNEIETFMRSV